MIRATGRLLDPGNIDVEITITMPLAQWEGIMDQLQNIHPSPALFSNLEGVLHKLRGKVLHMEVPS